MPASVAMSPKRKTVGLNALRTPRRHTALLRRYCNPWRSATAAMTSPVWSRCTSKWSPYWGRPVKNSTKSTNEAAEYGRSAGSGTDGRPTKAAQHPEGRHGEAALHRQVQLDRGHLQYLEDLSRNLVPLRQISVGHRRPATLSRVRLNCRTRHGSNENLLDHARFVLLAKPEHTCEAERAEEEERDEVKPIINL